MKTLEQIRKLYKSETLDGRDINRLVTFIPESELSSWNIELLPAYVGKHQHLEFTEANVLAQLQKDVAFGFEKALNKRGISASLMYEVVEMWNWILENELADFDTYAQYGLPLFRATAVKYGFNNPIGDDQGDEFKYSTEADYDE